jgi:DNA-binding SARP family transcriptional activator/DNA-binding XRE family transcriptional regulator
MGSYGEGLACEFGSLVRKYRHAAELTQLELAETAGISVAALRDFEQSRRHRPRSGTLAALTAALDLDPEQAASFARAAGARRSEEAPIQPWHGGTARALGLWEPHCQGLWITALGPLEAWRDGTQLPLGPPARRAVLGLLLTDPGAPVRRDTIIDVLWGEAPPPTAAGLVQAHVSRIRRHLDPWQLFGSGVISSARGAYRFCLSSEELDLLAFRNLAAHAAAAWANGDEAIAIECYEQAIRMWRGDPLADLAMLDGYPGITALRQELVGVLLRYVEVACALGLYFRVLPRLRALADADPLDESVHALLMIALAGCGQQAAAIRVYQSVRSRLDRELGLYPGEELTKAYGRVLRQDIGSGTEGHAPVRWSARSSAGPLTRRGQKRRMHPAGPVVG